MWNGKIQIYLDSDDYSKLSIETSINPAYGEENNWLDYSKWHASFEDF